MDWFLYDRDLRHERVQLENSKEGIGTKFIILKQGAQLLLICFPEMI